MALKDESILAIGMISIALGLLIGRFVHFEYSGFSVSDFLEGVLVGLSLVMNLTYLIRQKLKNDACSSAMICHIILTSVR
jgi:1,4-dihydroxy-2-naphthoate octaprenyltransferase